MCRDDSVLRRELDSLLAHERSGDSLVEAAAARPLPSLVGRVLGSYDVLAVLGAGGMGHVYLAHDTKLNRDVALKIDINGGPPQVIGEVPRGWGGGAWNRDDVIVLGQAEGGLLRLPGAGGAAIPLTRLDSSRQEVGHGGPRFLPDGRHFIYSRASRIPDHTALYVGSVDAGPDEQPAKPLLVTDSRPAYAPSGDPDRGYLLVVREGVLLAYPFDNRRLALAGDPAPIADGVGAVPNGPVSIASVSASGNVWRFSLRACVSSEASLASTPWRRSPIRPTCVRLELVGVRESAA